MKIEALKSEKIIDFVEYCKEHRKDLDDSFLYDEDLEKFEINEENPTYIITNEDGELIAAASLIIDEYNKWGRKGRFRIFHSETENLECYNMLMQAMLKHTGQLDKVFMFIPMVNKNLIKSIEELKFNVERYSFLLLREELEIREVNLPPDYEIKPFRASLDEKVWCDVRNASFAKLKGSETPITPEMAAKLISSDDFIEGGMMILYHKGSPIGVVRGSKDDYENSPIMNIGPLAIIPEYQGMGLGRCLLRASIYFAKEHDFSRTILCVNAENDRAKALYIQEGFKQVEAVVCYKYDFES